MADARLADAPRDVGMACATTTCGTTCCATAAQICSPGCSCPSAFVPQPFSTVIAQMDTTRIAPAVLGIGVFSGTDSKLHALVVAFDPATVPLNTDITLPVSPFGSPPYVGLGYDVNVSNQTTKSTFFASQGTLHLTRACASGVAGSVTGVMLREQTSMDNPQPAPMGCTIALPDLSFDYAGSCP